jgi:ELP3 family radical SAM enzyme/protein acetyltransferase
VGQEKIEIWRRDKCDCDAFLAPLRITANPSLTSKMSSCAASLSTESPKGSDIEDIEIRPSSFMPNPPVAKLILKDIIKMDPSNYATPEKLNACFRRLAKKYKYQSSKRELGLVYRTLLKKCPGQYPYIESLWNTLINKSVRSESGIVNVSISLPPDQFSCKYNCHFCPNEPGMPRSYLSNEDVFARAAKVGFDTVRQVYNRLDVLEKNGHPIDKLEFRVLGGTFSCYDKDLADAFVRDLYYAANTYYDDDEAGRARGTIEEEQAINVTAKVHVVGLGVETRPDEIDEAEIVRFRRYGVTRVEIGVQHTDDNLLRKVNRGHLTKHSKAAVKLLKDYGFKVEIHIMADLPGATPEGDMKCYEEVLCGEDLVPDYMKDYPCLDVDFTKIKEWKASGKWKPYAEATPDAADLKRVLVYRQQITPPWVRVNRVQRDFQEAREDNLGYTSTSIKTNLAQLVKDDAEAQGIYCQCIRCCEVSTEKYAKEDIQYRVQSFTASGAREYFISAIVEKQPRNMMLGFVRLRLGTALESSIIPELVGKTAMIRELHVYGRVKEVGGGGRQGASAQHFGIGKSLLAIAEEISTKYGYKQIAIISGIGVRDYYRKRGYELRGTYMMKNILGPMADIWCLDIAIIMVFLAITSLSAYLMVL